MKRQDYTNHKKYYPLHHFVLLPALLLCIGIAVRNYFSDAGNELPWLLFAISSFVSLALAVMLRQHYALGNQDRIVRLEFRLRHFVLLNKSSSLAERQLSFGR